MYGLTLIPSVLAWPFIFVVKTFVNIYLFVEMILRIVSLPFHPATEKFIWTTENWLAYSFRRWIVDWLLTPVHFFT